MSIFSSAIRKIKPAAWIGGAVGGLPGAFAGQLFGGGGGSGGAPTGPVDPYGREGLVNQENAAMGDATGRGQQALNKYQNFAENFDASKGLNQYAQGAWGSISDALKQNLQAESGAAVGAGRINTGFYDEDRGTIYNRATKQLSDSIAQQSLNAQGQQIGVMQGYGNYGQNEQGTGLDLLTARRQELENNAREQDAQKRKKRSGIGGLIGGALGAGVGFFAGGGVPGAMAGWGLGSAAGSAIG